ncbi:MAG: hypothetical protein CM1200mP39_26350 [Dehalococcoidia bacterium]|nr:MAG: hypothetical protein CM1200mP39_26350 [Dehalococcoidia bacterium]
MGKKLFVGSLAWATDSSGLRAAFERFGDIEEAQVSATARPEGRAVSVLSPSLKKVQRNRPFQK